MTNAQDIRVGDEVEVVYRYRGKVTNRRTDFSLKEDPNGRIIRLDDNSGTHAIGEKNQTITVIKRARPKVGDVVKPADYMPKGTVLHENQSNVWHKHSDGKWYGSGPYWSDTFDNGRATRFLSNISMTVLHYPEG